MQLEVLSHVPVAPVSAPPVLFVHGAWHGAWCWAEHFLPYFADQGLSAHALSFRGHGHSAGAPRVRGLRIGHYVADLAQMAATLPVPPILVGHSMGGLVVQKYLERHPARAAVLLASVPPHGALPTTLRIIGRHPGPFLRANVTTRLWPIVGTTALAHDALFSATLPAATVQAYANQIQDESYLAYLEMVATARPRPRLVRARHPLPVLVLGGANDHIFTPAEIRQTARAYATQPTIFPDMAHDMMLEPGWQQVADTIIAWIKGLA